MYMPSEEFPASLNGVVESGFRAEVNCGLDYNDFVWPRSQITMESSLSNTDTANDLIWTSIANRIDLSGLYCDLVMRGCLRS